MRRLGCQAIAGLFIFAATSAVTVPALAQSAADSATSQALFDRGKELASAGKYTEAISAFEESQRIESRSGTLLNLAICYERVGRFASAWTTFLEAVTRAKAENKDARQQDASARAAALVPKLSRLEIHARYAADTPGLEVTRNGVSVGAAQFGLALPVDAGPYTVRARAPGRKTWEQQVVVLAGAKTAKVDVPALEVLSADDPAPVAAPQRATDSSTPTADRAAPLPPRAETPSPSPARPSRITTGVVIGGATTAALAIGTVVTGVLYNSKHGEYDRANNALDADSADLERQTKTLGVVNLALLGGTLVAAGVTAYLVIRAPSSGSNAGARIELRGQVAPSFTGLSLQGRL